FSNVPAGDYTVSFSSGTNVFNSLKIDDVRFAVSPVPEPETYALMLGGLLAVGFVARRKGGRKA
ncbi:MAG: hypothetical protein JWQ11_952, partial [Rhizobacter sp.]|nr:hypothetical protein [Rhizobacter sp.]